VNRLFSLAGWLLLAGFTGSVVGLVYALPLLLDKAWFIVMAVAAAVATARGIQIALSQVDD
jgi:hypothetical protein